MNLSRFTDSNLFIATEKFLTEDLGIPLTGSVTQFSFPIKEILRERFKNQEPYTKVKESYFIGGIDQTAFESEPDNLFKAQNRLSKETVANEKYDGLLLFAVKFEVNYEPTRADLADLTRAFNIVFHYCPTKNSIKLSEAYS